MELQRNIYSFLLWCLHIAEYYSDSSLIKTIWRQIPFIPLCLQGAKQLHRGYTGSKNKISILDMTKIFKNVQIFFDKNSKNCFHNTHSTWLCQNLKSIGWKLGDYKSVSTTLIQHDCVKIWSRSNENWGTTKLFPQHSFNMIV